MLISCGHLEGHARDAKGLGGPVLPVGLRDLLPHHHVEASAGLVAEDKASIVVITLRVHVEGPAEIHSIELIKTWGRRTEDSLSTL